MKDLKSILKECSIKEIYCDNHGAPITYVIPIYQRNYAWERDEICALIKDVHDSMDMGKTVYYIGTLVTYKRDENKYEVIDGQQRLTTIYLILRALGVQDIYNRLTYSARKASASTIKALSGRGEKEDLSEMPDLGIKNGFESAKAGLNEIVGLAQTDVDKFKEYFLNHVHIIHYRVPKDVDLNHYFEVMNSRGEQLEKHEIVKAKLSEQFIGDNTSMEKFSRIWEACSDMCFYVQQKMSDMKTVFGENMDSFVLESFEAFANMPANAGNSLGRKTIAELLNTPVKPVPQSTTLDENDRFQPIIDFPNFLLIVLKITRMKEQGFDPLKLSLDDKELLHEFEKINITADFVKRFAYNLLKAKYFLDNYVVHHTLGEDRISENPWKLQRYYKNGNAVYLKDLSEDKPMQAELVQLLSMFEVTFTAKQRKNYLFYCLYHLFENDNMSDYLVFMRDLADKYFFDVYLNAEKLNERNQPKPNSFDDTLIRNGHLNVELENVERDFNLIYPKGALNIPLYVFDYTDYKIWRKYAEELRGEKAKKGDAKRIGFFQDLGCSDFELEVFNNFYFSRTRKSLEHYYPQAKAGSDKPISSEDINCFGNFAMIGSDANSSGSDWNPIDKKNRYLDSKSNQVSTASLKFRIMLQICQDNYDDGIKDKMAKRPFGLEWDVDDMNEHQERMLKIVMKR